MANRYVTRESDLESAVNDAFSGIEELKDELQNWYDNLHENFQNGSKGEALHEAISNLEGGSEPSVPDCLSGLNISYHEDRKSSSRATRRDTYCSMLEGVISTAGDHKAKLELMEFKEEGDEVIPYHEGEKLTEEDNPEELPLTEADRDSMVDEINQFISDCEDAKDEWENAEFPGMYG